MDVALGMVFPPFQSRLRVVGRKIRRGLGTVIRKSAITLLVYGGLVSCRGGASISAHRFVPRRTAVLVAFAQLPMPPPSTRI